VSFIWTPLIIMHYHTFVTKSSSSSRPTSCSSLTWYHQLGTLIEDMASLKLVLCIRGWLPVCMGVCWNGCAYCY